MSQFVAQAFLATAEATIVYSGSLSSEQLATLGTIRQTAVANGEQTSVISSSFDDDSGNRTYISYYSNSATATAIVNAANAFTPAPVSATVTAL